MGLQWRPLSDVGLASSDPPQTERSQAEDDEQADETQQDDEPHFLVELLLSGLAVGRTHGCGGCT